jgi:hypothetical protein
MVKKIISRLASQNTLALVVALTLVSGLWMVSAAQASPPRALLASGPPPSVINYQGVVKVDGVQYNGNGYFKFAIINSDGSTTFWSNDNTSSGGSEPSAAVMLPVNYGLFNVLLGDTNLVGMTQPLDETAFGDTETRLRVWFSSNPAGPFIQLSPDQRVTSVAYALRAKYADNAGTAGPSGPSGLAAPRALKAPVAQPVLMEQLAL